MTCSQDGAAAAATEGMHVEDLEPAAGLSSASSCIKLSLLGSTFRPVYLHQVFSDERIPGWRPTAEAEMEARATAGVCRHLLASLSVTIDWSLAHLFVMPFHMRSTHTHFALLSRAHYVLVLLLVTHIRTDPKGGQSAKHRLQHSTTQLLLSP